MSPRKSALLAVFSCQCERRHMEVAGLATTGSGTSGLAAGLIATFGLATDHFPTEFRAPTVYPRKIPEAIT